MNGTETKDALSEIAMRKATQYQEKLDALEAASKTERKALTIGRNMAQSCANFVNIEYQGHFFEVREKRVFGQEYHDFDEWKPVYAQLSAEQRESFLVFAYAVTMTRHCLLEKRLGASAASPEQPKTENEIEKAFEAKIIVRVIGEILREWQRFWNQNGCTPCEVIR